MKKTKILSVALASIACVAMLSSCDFWNESWYKDGDSENAPLTGSTASGGRVSEPNVITDNRSVLIRDSDTARPVANAQIAVQQNLVTILTMMTGSNGIASFPSGQQLADGIYRFIITSSGYMSTTDDLSIANNGIVAGNQISIPKTINEPNIKIILDWGLTPEDLDSHLRMGNYHVWYYDKVEQNGNMDLDHDDVNGLGPETITIRNVDPSATYKYYVHNYSESPAITTSGARVRVYRNNTQLNTYVIPTTGNGLYWHVFNITGGSNFVNGAGIVQSEPQ